MRHRLGLWSLTGFLVAIGWVLFLATVPQPVSHSLLNIIEITAPAALLRHFPLKYYSFIVLNTLIYLLAGMVIEMWRRNFVQHSSKSPAA